MNILLNSHPKLRYLYSLNAEEVNEHTFAAIGRMKQLEVMEMVLLTSTAQKLLVLESLSIEVCLIYSETIDLFRNNFGMLRHLELNSMKVDDIGTLLEVLPDLEL